MEQIQQHEWVRKPGTETFSVCSLCECVRLDGDLISDHTYRAKGGKFQYEQPACIPRTINAPLRQADK